MLTTALLAAAAVAAPLPQGSEPVQLDPADFTSAITNPYWPMPPGRRWVSRETSPDGTSQRNVVTVLRRTRRVADGIRARVVHDVVTERGRKVEDTYDWYAQDRDGNVWYLGEDTTAYEDGRTSKEGSFEAGVDGAQPGVVVPARPEPGLRYRQEHRKGHAEDRAEVVALDWQAQVPFGHFRDVLVTREWSPLEPRVLELKLYAKGVGPVLAIGVSGGADREELLRMRR
ncbi:MAG: hypothetical protein HZB46_02470 [Solirubrobacterales bacterium]|nr:hypothetical protein [Solirubrobacterales bacterium]